MLEDPDDEALELVSPEVLMDDVEQEAWILRALGKTPNKAIIRKRLGLQGQGELLYYDLPGYVVAEEPWASDTISLEAIRELVDWSNKQGEEVKLLILRFLNNPQMVEEVIRELGKLGAVHSKVERRKEVSLSTLLFNHLPATYQALVELIAQASPTTKRPAATVRQFIRRQREKGTITISGEIIKRTEEL